MTTTCQICGREIKAKTGLIAHHGYRRPNRGSGWQTASCMGARYRPYEVACDALPSAIGACERHIIATQEALGELVANPPETLTFYRRGRHFDPLTGRRSIGWDTKTFEVQRPEGFDPNRNPGSYRPYSYDSEFFGRKRAWERDIKASSETLAYLTDRLANWKAPE